MTIKELGNPLVSEGYLIDHQVNERVDQTPEKNRHILRYLDGHSSGLLRHWAGGDESRTIHSHFFRFHPSPSFLSPPSPWLRRSTKVDANDRQGSARNGRVPTRGSTRDLGAGHHVRTHDQSEERSGHALLEIIREGLIV